MEINLCKDGVNYCIDSNDKNVRFDLAPDCVHVSVGINRKNWDFVWPFLRSLIAGDQVRLYMVNGSGPELTMTKFIGTIGQIQRTADAASLVTFHFTVEIQASLFDAHIPQLSIANQCIN